MPKNFIRYIFIFWLSTVVPLLFADNIKSKEPVPLALAYYPLTYKPPNPGTYELPQLGLAKDGQVIGTNGKTSTLYREFGDKTVLLSFIYSTCSDVNGCPLSTMVLHKIKNRFENEATLRDRLRLVTLSFDPEHDRPEIMKSYAQGLKSGGLDWRFLTTSSEKKLQPILQSYQQTIRRNYDENGNFEGTFSHILRVYLIDESKQIRNIYSVSFLHEDTLVNDIKTLLLVNQENVSVVSNSPSASSQRQPELDQANGIHTLQVAKDPSSPNNRIGKMADLLSIAMKPPLGLPALSIPLDNPITREKIALGRRLFYDRRLSFNNTMSCAMCHIPEQGFTNNEMATAVGIEGRTVRRNAPTIYNVGYATGLFHDGRESKLEQQVWGPLLAKNEMGNPSVGYVIDKIRAITDYKELFLRAFDREPTMQTVGEALATYQRTLVSANSAFDRWFFGNQPTALGKEAIRGFNIFKSKAACTKCHTLNANDALFTDNQLHNTGLGYKDTMSIQAPTQSLSVSPSLTLEIDRTMMESVSEVKPSDLGSYEITNDPNDRWKYKTPSLRNVALTAPYMHNGALSTLADVIDFYNDGGIANDNLDPLINPLNLDAGEKTALVLFLESLTGDNVTELVKDAFAVPTGNLE